NGGDKYLVLMPSMRRVPFKNQCLSFPSHLRILRWLFFSSKEQCFFGVNIRCIIVISVVIQCVFKRIGLRLLEGSHPTAGRCRIPVSPTNNRFDRTEKL